VAMSESVVVPAATVIVLRDGPTGVETLMLRRNSRGQFADHWVFPGGKVDPGDGDDEMTAARNAAVREAQEEAGIALKDELLPISFWMPDHIMPRRFATWFFVTQGSEDEIRIDNAEIHEHAWLAPSEVLARQQAKTLPLAPPTWMTLHTLKSFAKVADVLAWARDHPPGRFLTRMAHREDGAMVAMWDGDAGYSSGDPTTVGARRRLVMGEPWTVEHSR
jgi:8-oxo-dGTP pyrophosphatase MutT (NUDIX family)